MTFTRVETTETEYERSGAGELHSSHAIHFSATSFTNGQYVGRFAKSGGDRLTIANLDASATPVIAGIVRRPVGNVAADGDLIYNTVGTQTRETQVEYINSGLVTVYGIEAETPSFGDVVYAHNTVDGDEGKATTVVTDAVVNATYIETIKAGVWLVKLV